MLWPHAEPPTELALELGPGNPTPRAGGLPAGAPSSDLLTPCPGPPFLKKPLRIADGLRTVAFTVTGVGGDLWGQDHTLLRSGDKEKNRPEGLTEHVPTHYHT